jgi:oxalyl-CoA decarboxylase
MPRTSASALPGPSARPFRADPGGVYLDLPAKLLGQTMDAVAGEKSLVKVIDPAPAQIPGPDAVTRALDVLRAAKRPLIILGKGAAYAQADDDIRELVEKSGIPFLPMSMAKGLLPDNHPQSAAAARSLALKESDVVMLIGARLNWLLSHGKGKAWGDAPKKFVQIDIEPKEMDSNVEIAAPVVGDIGSCVRALIDGMGKELEIPADRWDQCDPQKVEANIEKMAPRLMNNNVPMDFHGALGVLRTIIKERPDAILVNEGANTLDFARSIIDMYKPRKRLDVGTWGIMGIGMGRPSPPPSRPAIPCSRSKATARSASPAWRLRRSAATTCRSAWWCSTTAASIAAPTSIRRAGRRRDHGLRQGRALRQDDGGVRRRRRQCHVARRAETRRQRGDGFRQADAVNAVIDEKAGTESGRIGNLNPQSVVSKKK